MSNTPKPYISNDIDRTIFITASISGFFFIVTWTLYGINKLIGDETDWRPMGHSVITKATQSILCKEFLCRRRTLYEAGSDSESEDEAASQENSEPENEESDYEVEGWGGTEAKID